LHGAAAFGHDEGGIGRDADAGLEELEDGGFCECQDGLVPVLREIAFGRGRIELYTVKGDLVDVRRLLDDLVDFDRQGPPFDDDLIEEAVGDVIPAAGKGE